MLNITLISKDTDLTFRTFKEYGLPGPVSGVDVEGADNLVLKFEDEEEAIIYADQLQTLSGELEDKSSPQYRAISDIISAIRSDEFVQSYTR